MARRITMKHPRTGKPINRFSAITAGVLGAALRAAATVTFTCDNPECWVTIEWGPSRVTFVSRGRMKMPVGQHQVLYVVGGAEGTPFSLETEGAQMTAVHSTAPSAGFADVVVG